MIFYKNKYTSIQITKELIGIQMSLNATTMAKVYMANIINKKLDDIFSNTDNVIVLPSFVNDGKHYESKKIFKSKYKDFDENSLCIVINYATFDCFKEVADKILNQFDIDEVLIRFGSEIYLYQNEVEYD